MKLFNLSVGRLVTSNLAFAKADASQIKSFNEAIFFFCKGETNGTRICGMTVLVIVFPKWSGSTVCMAWPSFSGLTVYGKKMLHPGPCRDDIKTPQLIRLCDVSLVRKQNRPIWDVVVTYQLLLRSDAEWAMRRCRAVSWQLSRKWGWLTWGVIETNFSS